MALSFAERNCILLIRVSAFALLARLLAPHEFGLFATASAAVGVGTVLADIGVRQYLIRVEQLTLEAQRAALGLSLSVAAAVVAVILGVCLLAPGAWIDVDLRWAVGLLGFAFLLEPFNVVASAVLQREMRFGTLYWVGVARTLVQVAVAVGLALAGVGALSLAWAGVAEGMATAVMLHAVRGVVRPSLAGWRDVFSFGWIWSAIWGIERAGEALAQLVVSTMLGYGTIGLLSRAEGIVLLFDRLLSDAILPVILPLASERQREGGDLDALYLRQFACLAALAWPFFGAMALLAEPLVALLLGPGWSGAVPAVRILAATGLFVPFYPVTPYLVALGVVRRYLPIQVGVQTGKLAFIVPASLVSLELVCVVLVAELAVLTAATQRVLRPAMGYRLRDLARLAWLSVAPSAGCLGGAAAAVLALGHSHTPVVPLVAALGAGAPAWLLVLLMVRHPLRDELRRLRLFLPPGLRPVS